MNIKEIVLEAVHSTVPAYWLSDEKPIACSTSNFERLVSFAEALVSAYKAELLKEVVEPVAIVGELSEPTRSEVVGKGNPLGRYLFASDQVAAAILKATQTLDEEVARLQEEDNLPVRYYQPNGKGPVYAVYGSSSIDFVEELRTQLAAAQEENDVLRRIHKENIEILVKELSDKDYDYNQKTNRLIKRHAEQIRRCNDEVNRRRYNSDSELPDDYEVN